MRFTLSVFATLAVTVGIAVAQDASPSAAQAAFNKATIPKDLHLKAFNPKAVLNVSFPTTPQTGSKPAKSAIPLGHGGAQLPVKDISNPPTFGLRAPGKPVNIGKGPFVITIVDLDAPTPNDPYNGPVRHFLGGGFTFKNDGVSLVNNTPAVTEYEPPSPPKGSKAHRCVFLLFDQPTGFQEQKEVGPDTGRNVFNVSQFAEKVGLGAPIAGTYLLVGPQN